MGGELDDQALGQRFDAIIVLIVVALRVLSADGDDSAPNGQCCGSINPAVLSIDLGVAAIDGNRRLVFGPHIATGDHDVAVAIHADEDPGASDVGGIVDDRALLEGIESFLDLAQALIDLVRQLVGAVILRLEPIVFRAQRLAFGPLFVG